MVRPIIPYGGMQDNSALVTGAASGIGRATSRMGLVTGVFYPQDGGYLAQ
jgi:NAD(P)-dependent dehydrogenase (short-subunit alcohol dehydrogenase family)